MLKQETYTYFRVFKWRKLNINTGLIEEPSPFKLHVMPTLLLETKEKGAF